MQNYFAIVICIVTSGSIIRVKMIQRLRQLKVQADVLLDFKMHNGILLLKLVRIRQ